MRRLPARVSAVVPVFFLVALRLVPASAAPASDKAEQQLAAMEKDEGHRSLLAGPLGKAKNALDRARAMDAAGDVAHGSAMRAVAGEWLDLGRDLVRAADTEARAVAAEKALDELETKLVRERALLEETVARRGRAREALEQLERQPPPPPADSKRPKGGKPPPSKGARPSPPPAPASEPRK